MQAVNRRHVIKSTAALAGTRLLREWIEAGLIGEVKEEIIGDAEATEMLSKPFRDKWKIW